MVIAGLAFAIFEPIQVLPRIRLAPGYALTAPDGSTLTSEDGRGSVTLYAFAPADCTTAACADMEATMRAVRTRVGEEVDFGDSELRLITIALDPTDAAGLAGAADRSGADGKRWRWLGSSDPREIRRVVGQGFERYFEYTHDGFTRFDPSFVLVDGNGVVRGDYKYSTLADDADKLTDHMSILAEEIRHAGGATAVAYEAAHLFLCYP